MDRLIPNLFQMSPFQQPPTSQNSFIKPTPIVPNQNDALASLFASLANNRTFQTPPTQQTQHSQPSFFTSNLPSMVTNPTSETRSLKWSENLVEITAKILFGLIDWLKSLPALRALSESDQISVIRNSWKDLFLLSMVELYPMLLLIPSENNNQDRNDDEINLAASNLLKTALKDSNGSALLRASSAASSNSEANGNKTGQRGDFVQLTSVLAKLHAMNLDHNQISLMKMLMISKQNMTNISEKKPLEALLNQTIASIVATQGGAQIIQMTLAMLTVANINEAIIQTSLFRTIIGDVPLPNLVIGIYSNRFFNMAMPINCSTISPKENTSAS